MKHRRTLFSLFPLVATAGCVLPPSAAELHTYHAVAPEYRAYVEADPTLPPDAKQRRYDMLEAWRLRVGGDQ